MTEPPILPPRDEGSEPDDPDGLMNDQEMPTADGEMASNTSEEVRPPKLSRPRD